MQNNKTRLQSYYARFFVGHEIGTEGKKKSYNNKKRLNEKHLETNEQNAKHNNNFAHIFPKKLLRIILFLGLGNPSLK